MRALVQRVSQASVSIDGGVVGEIGPGLLVLLGITHEDGAEDRSYLIRKLLQLRIFKDEEGKMNLDVQQAGGELLVVSQFTLFGDTKKGNRPSFVRSAPPAQAIPQYEAFLQELEAAHGQPVACGQFGADMQVALVNDGPVTLMLDSQLRDY